MIIIELEYKNHPFKEQQYLECGCLVLTVKDHNNISLKVCDSHKKEFNLALKQSIISKSKQ